MINTKYSKNILTFLLLSNGMADLASPTPFKVTQPNGIEIHIYNRGNHLQGWHEYHEWTIVKNPQNWWVYASGNDGFSRIAIKGVEGGKSTTRSQVDLAAHSNRKEGICVICCQS